MLSGRTAPRQTAQLADQALVMEKGTLTFDGSGAELERSGDLRKTYLG